MSGTPHIDPGRGDRFVSRVGDYLMRLPEPASIGEALPALRDARGVTQAELAKRLGTEETDVAHIERAASHELSALRAYLRALECAELELHAAFTDGARIALPLPTAKRTATQRP